jgi:hypothetical protein
MPTLSGRVTMRMRGSRRASASNAKSCRLPSSMMMMMMMSSSARKSWWRMLSTAASRKRKSLYTGITTDTAGASGFARASGFGAVDMAH